MAYLSSDSRNPVHLEKKLFLPNYYYLFLYPEPQNCITQKIRHLSLYPKGAELPASLSYPQPSNIIPPYQVTTPIKVISTRK